MRIITTTSRPTAVRRSNMIDVAIAAGEDATAILTFERDQADHVAVSTIDRLPSGLAPARGWLEAAFPDLPELGAHGVILDVGEGLGGALRDRLHVAHKRGWLMYEGRGRDRQALSTGLLRAQDEGRVHIAPSPNRDALAKALLAIRKVVGEDGVVGGELAVALALAFTVKPYRGLRIY